MTATIESCPGCNSPLAEDQRYCLECGARRNGSRAPFDDRPAGHPPSAAPPPPSERRLDGIPPAMAAAGVAVAVLFLGVGVLIGRAGTSEQPVAAKPTVVRVAGGAAPAAASEEASVKSVKSDWPAGQEGWTVQLEELPKDGTEAAEVAAAKEEAESKGAPDVGFLDTDRFESLPPSTYVVYSGRFDSKGEASAALKKLRGDFPGAKLLHVTTGAPAIDSAKAKADEQAVQELEGLSGSDYAKKARKLPDTLALPGEPPPKDSKEGGGGTGFDTIE